MSATVCSPKVYLNVCIQNDPATEVEWGDEVYVIPGRCSKGLLDRYLDLGVVKGISGYHGSSYEMGVWE